MGYDNNSIEGRFLAGDPPAVADVTRWVAQSLCAPSFWSLRSLRKDLHQEVMGRILESLHAGRFDPERNFRVYVQGIGRFTAYKAISRESREMTARDPGPSPLPEVSEPGHDPESRVAVIRTARRALQASTEECRRLIGDYFLREKNFQEIAEAGDLPVGTVKSRLFRCLEAVRKALQIRREPDRGSAE